MVRALFFVNFVTLKMGTIPETQFLGQLVSGEPQCTGISLTKANLPRSKRVFRREILSRDETRPMMKSSLSVVKFLLLFTRFC